jgi:hypothetical protein
MATPTQPPDHVFQAEAFLALFQRSDASTNLEAAFQAWVDSKDFSPRDQLAITREVHRILGNDHPGETVRIFDARLVGQESGQKSLTASGKEAENA